MISKLGFKKGRILECIVTTYNADGSPNAAPMGVRALGEKDVLMKIYADTRTYANVIRNECCAINISYDPLLFLKTAVKAEKPKVMGSDVSRSRVNAPFLNDAHAFIEARLKRHREAVRRDKYKKSTLSIMRFAAVRVRIIKKHPFGINRGLCAAVEAAIALSRGAGIEKKHMEIMRRTMSKGEYRKISEFLGRFR